MSKDPGRGGAPLGLAARVSVAAGAAVLVVLAAFGLILHHSLQDAIAGWERENLAALAHHAAEMVAAAPPDERPRAAQRLAAELAAFGVDLRWVEPGSEGDVADAAAVSVPVEKGGGDLRLTSSRPARETLGRRLAVLYALLLAALFAALVLAVQVSVYWGLVRPLRRVRTQLERMRRGPWKTDAAAGGGAEVVELAGEIEALGFTLEHQISTWVEAERKAGGELARRRLRRAVLDEVREIDVLVGDAMARDGSPPASLRDLRRVQAASERIAGLLDRSFDGAEERGESPTEVEKATPVREGSDSRQQQ